MHRPHPGQPDPLRQHGCLPQIFPGWHGGPVALRRAGGQTCRRVHLYLLPARRAGEHPALHDVAAATPRHAHGGRAVYRDGIDGDHRWRYALRPEPPGGSQQRQDRDRDGEASLPGLGCAGRRRGAAATDEVKLRFTGSLLARSAFMALVVWLGLWLGVLASAPPTVRLVWAGASLFPLALLAPFLFRGTQAGYIW